MTLRTLVLGIAVIAACLPVVTFADIRLAEPNTTALSQGLVGYWSMDGGTINWSTNTVKDLSGKGDTGNLISMSTTSSAVAGKIGGALKFTSSSAEEMSLGTAPSSLTFAYNQPFTISLWAKPSATVSSGIFDRLFSIAGSAGQFEYFVMANNNALSFNVGKNATGDISVSSPFTVGQWYHVVGIYDGTNVNLYINGKFVGSSAYTFGALSSATGVVSIGGAGGTSTVFNGTIDDVRVYNRVLSPQEVSLLYAVGTVNTGNTQAANSSFSIDQGGLNGGLVAYWPLDGNTTNWATGSTADVSGNSNSGTLIGMSTSSTPVAGKIGGAFKFNGSTAYISTAYTIPAQSSATSFTWSTWAYLGSGNTATVVLLGFRNGATWVKITPSSFEYSSGSIISYAVPTGQWVLLSVVKNGTNFTYYANGAAVGTASNSGSVVPHTFYIGADPGFPGDGTFSGMLDDVRVYNRALTAQEIADLYTAGKVNIDHSNTISSTGINSGLVGYWTFDGQTISWTKDQVSDVSGNAGTGTLFNISTSTSSSGPVAGKIGQALKFNGSSSYINVSPFPTNTTPLSISVWVYPTSLSQTSIGGASGGTIIDEDENGLSAGWVFGIKNTGVLWFWPSGSNDRYSTGVIPLNKWTYITAAYDGTNLRYYINGALDSTQTMPTPQGSATFFKIGSTSWITGYWQGDLDDLRMYNRSLSSQEVQQLYQAGR